MHGGRVYEYARRSARGIEGIVDFSANINPLGPPDGLQEALIDALPRIAHYPDSAQREAVEAFSMRMRVDPETVVCGNGATEVIELVLAAIRPRRVFLLEPAFSEYARAAVRVGAEPVRVGLFAPGASGPEVVFPAQTLLERVRARDVLILNNPHNPSGGVFLRRDWLETARRFSSLGAWLITDESFADFLTDESVITALPEAADEGMRVFVVRSATKIYAIPGLRLGFGVGPRNLVGEISRLRDGWSVNVLAQAAAAAYRDGGFLSRTRAWLRGEGDFVDQTWGRAAGITLYPHAANFFLVRFSSARLCRRLAEEAEKSGMFIRDCSDFRGLGPEYARIAIRSRADNERLWRLASEVVGLLPADRGG